jgi:multimeric flavodoxin WrbA
MKPFKVVGFSGSPRKESNTDIQVNRVLTACGENGADTEFVKITELYISPCDACWSCAMEGKCHIDDDMQLVYKKLAGAVGIIFGSPVHMGHSISGHAQIFLDRTFSFWHQKNLKDKVGGTVVVSNRRGGISAVRIINDVFLDHQIIIAGYATGFGLTPGDIQKDERAFKEATALGKRLCTLIVSVKR